MGTRLSDTRHGMVPAAGNTMIRSFRFGSVARALAFFLGGFGLFNILGELLVPHFDANIWWIDLRFAPAGVSRLFLFTASAFLLAYAIQPRLAAWRKNCTLGLAAVLLAATLRNAITFGLLLARGVIHSQLPVPLSLLIAGALLAIIFTISLARVHPPADEPGKPRGRIRRPLRAVARLVVLPILLVVLFPLAQMLCFGNTDYRRAADVIVVPGARVFANGRCSPALADRVATACALYRDGYATRLIFSGGPGDGTIYESAGMKALAVQLGVPEGAIIEDTAGLNTQATVTNSTTLCSANGFRRVLVVSHFYHLPRLKLSYQRAGWDVYTVPAKETVILGALPYYVSREVVALWAYYFRIPTA